MTSSHACPRFWVGAKVYGEVKECPNGRGWRWTFVPAGVEVSSDPFPSKSAAAQDLRPLQEALYPPWKDPDKRAAHLQHLLKCRSLRQQVAAAARRPALAFARGRLLEHPSLMSLKSCSDFFHSDGAAWGLPNLGDTCYINAVTQCLFHCKLCSTHTKSTAPRSWTSCQTSRLGSNRS